MFAVVCGLSDWCLRQLDVNCCRALFNGEGKGDAKADDTAGMTALGLFCARGTQDSTAFVRTLVRCCLVFHRACVWPIALRSLGCSRRGLDPGTRYQAAGRCFCCWGLATQASCWQGPSPLRLALRSGRLSVCRALLADSAVVASIAAEALAASAADSDSKSASTGAAATSAGDSKSGAVESKSAATTAVAEAARDSTDADPLWTLFHEASAAAVNSPSPAIGAAVTRLALGALKQHGHISSSAQGTALAHRLLAARDSQGRTAAELARDLRSAAKPPAAGDAATATAGTSGSAGSAAGAGSAVGAAASWRDRLSAPSSNDELVALLHHHMKVPALICAPRWPW